MIRRSPGSLKHQQSGQLGRNLLQVFEVRLHCDGVGNDLIVNLSHRITNGFGALPEVSIQTLLVCRYSRIASIPFSRPIPDLL